MGEAKRRRDAGTMPNADPVETFRVPSGYVGITIDVNDEPPFTLMVKADQLTTLLAQADTAYPRNVSYTNMAGCLADEFVATKRRRGNFTGVALAILCAAFHHPRHAQELRDGVSQALRRNNRAHISWQVKGARIALSLADRFVDLSGTLEHAPDAPFAFVSPASLGWFDPPKH